MVVVAVVVIVVVVVVVVVVIVYVKKNCDSEAEHAEISCNSDYHLISNDSIVYSSHGVEVDWRRGSYQSINHQLINTDRSSNY